MRTGYSVCTLTGQVPPIVGKLAANVGDAVDPALVRFTGGLAVGSALNAPFVATAVQSTWHNTLSGSLGWPTVSSLFRALRTGESPAADGVELRPVMTELLERNRLNGFRIRRSRCRSC